MKKKWEGEASFMNKTVQQEINQRLMKRFTHSNACSFGSCNTDKQRRNIGTQKSTLSVRQCIAHLKRPEEKENEIETRNIELQCKKFRTRSEWICYMPKLVTTLFVLKPCLTQKINNSHAYFFFRKVSNLDICRFFLYCIFQPTFVLCDFSSHHRMLFALYGIKWRFLPSVSSTPHTYALCCSSHWSCKVPLILHSIWLLLDKLRVALNEWTNQIRCAYVLCVYQRRKYTSQIMIYIHFGACFLSFRSSMIVMQTHTHTDALALHILPYKMNEFKRTPSGNYFLGLSFGMIVVLVLADVRCAYQCERYRTPHTHTQQFC